MLKYHCQSKNVSSKNRSILMYSSGSCKFFSRFSQNFNSSCSILVTYDVFFFNCSKASNVPPMTLQGMAKIAMLKPIVLIWNLER